MSLLRTIIHPYEQSWDKLRNNQREISLFESTITDLKAKIDHASMQQDSTQAQLDNLREKLPTPDGENRILTTQIAILNPLSWFFPAAKIDLNVKTALNEQIDSAEETLERIIGRSEKLESDLKSEQTKLPKATFSRNMAVVELVGLVAATYFAYAAAMALVYSVGFTAILLTGMYSIPALIFYDVYKMAQNADTLVNDEADNFDLILESDIRTLFRNVLSMIVYFYDNTSDDKFDIAQSRAKILTRNTVILRIFESNIRNSILGNSFFAGNIAHAKAIGTVVLDQANTALDILDNTCDAGIRQRMQPLKAKAMNLAGSLKAAGNAGVRKASEVQRTAFATCQWTKQMVNQAIFKGRQFKHYVGRKADRAHTLLIVMALQTLGIVFAPFGS